ncbi:universal stress protein [Streptomyces sp. NBC_01571]|uniref:universal stress protein n=1 Tax=unclassified Streptomyces TaxID=2593676 RepID=UPI0022536395|nr:universal stress protein [Streptomyces sp. NBC_01571]MCX4572677.1 universal stress protein [Streptomyces sp. NBC_01571]
MALPLVVGVDGSDSSLLAVDWAVDEAARHGVSLRLVYGSLWQRYEVPPPFTGLERPAEQVLAEHIVASGAERAERRNPEVKVTTDIIQEEAAAALVRESDGAFTLVTGSRGRGELKGMLLGSVGLAVAGRARCPVIVVRGDRAGTVGTHERILLGLGDTDTTTEAVRFAFREAEVRGCVLDVVRAWRSPVHPDVPAHAPGEELFATLGEAIAEHPRVRTIRTALEGPAGKVLVRRSAAADLLVVGARHRTGHVGLQLGCVNHILLHHAQCPVAVVPQRP